MDYIIATSNLTKSYKEKVVVDKVNLHVKKGDCICIFRQRTDFYFNLVFSFIQNIIIIQYYFMTYLRDIYHAYWMNFMHKESVMNIPDKL